MAYLEKRRRLDGSIRFRIRDKINGVKVTVVKNAGQWKDIANARLLEYTKQKAGNASDFLPKKRLPIEEMCDINLRLHGPTLKNGINEIYNSPYYNFRLYMESLKTAWAGKHADEINKLMVRDLLAPLKTIGTKLRWLGVIGGMFNNFEEWEEAGNILPAPYLLPRKNPAYQWRAEMKPSEKRELPDTRVLTPEEWRRFSKHLTPRARAICEAALLRCLRLADIRAISHLSIADGYIKGVQQKTGETFRVPVLDDHPKRYNFKNFNGDFEKAQIKAGLFYPAEHPLHFTAKDLRRTGATWAYRRTKDLVAVQKLLGHRQLSTTQRYLQIDVTDVHGAVQAIAFMARQDTTLVPHKAHKMTPQNETLQGGAGGAFPDNR